MSDPGDPRDSATPYMRRLAASMARSGEGLRTLPGRISRSLAPSTSGRRRRWRDLGLLFLALLPFAIALLVANARGGHGNWTIVQADAAPWLDPALPEDPRLRELVGQVLRLERNRVRGPLPLACNGARYRSIEQPLDGLFQGALAGRPDVGAQAAALGLAGAAIATLQVDCDNASFDFHRAGGDLLVLIDGAVLRLERR